MKPTALRLPIVAVAVLWATGCMTNDSPTSPRSSAPWAESQGMSGSDQSSVAAKARSGEVSFSLDEEFNCTNVGEVRARFSAPGWVDGGNVGLYALFAGFEDVPFELRVWWDYEGEPENFEDVGVPEDDVRRNGVLLDLETVVEHTYGEMLQPTTKRVRVELVIADQTGNCARVRDVTLRPSATPGGSSTAGVAPCAGHSQWMPVTCTTTNWVWSSDRVGATTVASASAQRKLFTDASGGVNFCSLDGTGWVSTATTVMSGCNTDWYHLGGSYTGNCGGWDGTVVRRLAMGPNECYDY